MRIDAKRHLKTMIRQGTTPLGAFVTSIDASTTEVLALAGFDFVIIDREHGPHDNATALSHIRAAEAGGVVPLMRVSDKSSATIQCALDLGAQGVIVPKIESREQAEAALSASLYGPAGTRGMCNGCHAAGYCSTEDWHDHQVASDENILLIPLIETVKGVDCAEGILNIQGIDFVFFGPGDLAAEMGVNLLDHSPRVLDAWNHVLEAAHSRGKFVISLGHTGFEAADVHAGVMDLMMFRTAAGERVRQHRDSTGLQASAG